MTCKYKCQDGFWVALLFLVTFDTERR